MKYRQWHVDNGCLVYDTEQFRGALERGEHGGWGWSVDTVDGAKGWCTGWAPAQWLAKECAKAVIRQLEVRR